MRLFPLIDRLLQRQPSAEPLTASADFGPKPDRPLCLVGDIHGRGDLLQGLLARHEGQFPDHLLVFLGDAIDRGPDSAQVLDLLQQHSRGGAVVLKGNHEAMLLSFMDNPGDEANARWLGHGGREFLASYGVSDPKDANARVAACAALREAMGDTAEDWLRARPCLWQSGNLIAAHAGMDARLSLQDQTEHSLLWSNPTLSRVPRDDGLWVAHGHVISDRAYVRDGRIALDTGAYASGILSYALVDPARAPSDRVILGSVSGPKGR